MKTMEEPGRKMAVRGNLRNRGDEVELCVDNFGGLRGAPGCQLCGLRAVCDRREVKGGKDWGAGSVKMLDEGWW